MILNFCILCINTDIPKLQYEDDQLVKFETNNQPAYMTYYRSDRTLGSLLLLSLIINVIIFFLSKYKNEIFQKLKINNSLFNFNFNFPIIEHLLMIIGTLIFVIINKRRNIISDYLFFYMYFFIINFISLGILPTNFSYNGAHNYPFFQACVDNQFLRNIHYFLILLLSPLFLVAFKKLFNYRFYFILTGLIFLIIHILIVYYDYQHKD